jgi:hypothetical protein
MAIPSFVPLSIRFSSKFSTSTESSAAGHSGAGFGLIEIVDWAVAGVSRMLNDVSKSVPMQNFFRANLALADGVVAAVCRRTAGCDVVARDFFAGLAENRIGASHSLHREMPVWRTGLASPGR